MTTTNFHSKNTRALILAVQWQSKRIAARNISFATLQWRHFEDHSYRSFFASLPLLDVVLGIAIQRAQKRNLDEHHADPHPFQNICGERDGRAPKCKRLAVKICNSLIHSLFCYVEMRIYE